MDIIKQLKINGATEVNGYTINDGGLEYHVLGESLLNRDILPELLNSGWDFCGLPMDLRKGSTKLDMLPIEEITLTTMEQQEMYDLLGEPFTAEELKQMISKTAVDYMPEPDTTYTITTREAFLEYLHMVDTAQSENDFKPINSFVAPQARFTYEEFMNGDYAEFFNIMEKRRRFSYVKLQKLIVWALQNGMKENWQAQDLCDFYMGWGLDGLYQPVISKYRQKQSEVLGAVAASADAVNATKLQSYTIGVLDKNGSYIVQDSLKHIQWKPVPEKLALNKMTPRGGDPAVVVPIELMATTAYDITVMECADCTIRYDYNSVYINKYGVAGLCALSLDASNQLIPPEFWRSDKYDVLKTNIMLKALARDTATACILPSTASSIKALTLAGTTVKSALMYYISHEGMDKKQADPNDPEFAPIDIINYVEGRPCSGRDEKEAAAKTDALNDFVEGISSIDNIAMARNENVGRVAKEYYEILYAAHYILGLSIDEIYDKLRDVREDQSISFFGNGYKLTLNIKHYNPTAIAFANDLDSYLTQQTATAYEFVYITTVAREVGTLEATRHIAVEGYAALNRGRVEEAIADIEDEFRKRVRTYIQQDQWVREELKARRFAVNGFFEACLKGQVSFPQSYGGAPYVPAPELLQRWRSELEYFIEPTFEYCRNNVMVSGDFHRYCVNAFITPTKVIPRKGFSIKETALAAVLPDYSRKNPALFNKLVQLGHLKPNHTAWEMLPDDTYLSEIEYTEPSELSNYWRSATLFQHQHPIVKDFVSVPHPADYIEAGYLHREDEEVEDDPNGTPVQFRIGEVKMLKREDFDDVFDLSVKDDSHIEGFKRFAGYTASDLFINEKVLLLSYPLSANIIVIVSREKFWTEETGVASYSEIYKLDPAKYPVRNIQGRKYVLRDHNGKMWEVEV